MTDPRYVTIRLPKKLVFTAVTIVLIAAALEIGQRVSDWKKLSKRGPVNDVYAVRGETARGIPLTDKRGGLALVHHPYLLYKNKPSRRVTGPYGSETVTMTINAQGFRGPDWPQEKARGARRAIVLGGSAAFGHGASADEKVFPVLLERALRARAPAVEVLNAATSGYDARQELILFETELLAYAPDAIILFDGWNDFFYADATTDEHGGCHRMFWDLEEVIARGQETGKNLLRLSAFYRGVERKWPAARAALGGPPAPDRNDPVVKYGEYHEHVGAERRYAATLERICRLARAYGVRVVIAPQPEIFLRKGPVPAAEREERGRQPESYAAVARAGYPRYVAAAREVAAAEGAIFCDCSAAFDGSGDVAFVDRVHFNDRGNEILAETLLPAVTQALGME